MHGWQILRVLAYSLPILIAARPPCAMTFSGGERLGDQLKVFIKAHYFAQKMKVPCYYKPFTYSDQFYFSRVEKPCPVLQGSKTKEYEVTAFTPRYITQPWIAQKPIMYVCCFSTLDGDFLDAIHDREFKAQMRELLTPLFPVHVEIPQDRISVALHVRKGGGYDMPLKADGVQIPAGTKAQGGSNPANKPSDVIWPAKFIPEQFYVDALKKLHEIVGGAPLSIFLFTDDPNPEKVAERLAQKAGLQNVEFKYRAEENRHDAHVVEDFFAMTYFDCLIRPDSGISHMAEFIGNHGVVIKPGKVEWRKDVLCIDTIVVRIREHAPQSVLVGILNVEPVMRDKRFVLEKIK